MNFIKKYRQKLDINNKIFNDHYKDENIRSLLKIDKMMLKIVYFHWIIVSTVSAFEHSYYLFGFINGGIVSLVCTLGYRYYKGTRAFRVMIAMSLVAFSMILVQQHLGRIEFHFHFFILLSFLIAYKDIVPINFAVVFIIIYHWIFNYLQSQNIYLFDTPIVIFNYSNSLDTVLLHGIFVIFTWLVITDIIIGKVKDFIRKVDKQKKSNALAIDLQKNIAFFDSYKKALDEGNIVSKSDLNGVITYVNDRFCKITGYTHKEVIGKPHSILRHPDNSSSIFKKMWDTIQAKQVWKGKLRNKKKNGDTYWSSIVILPILDENNNICEYIAVRHDITEMINQQKEIEHSAQTDALTGLGNRFKLINDINSCKHPAIALINMDNFREINEFYGHQFGDFLIIELGNLMFDIVLKYKKIELYHLQGDEFAILCNDVDEDIFIKRVYQIINNISSNSIIIQSEEISVRLTTSISFEKEKIDLFKTASIAMKLAKKNKENLLIYDKSLFVNEKYENNIKWTRKLKKAIENDKLVPFFQPIVNNYTGKFEKYECLIRMIDEDGEIISPYFFLEIAKKTKHYTTLTRIMIKKSFETFKDIDAEFSINFSISDIMNPKLNEYMFKMLEEYGVAKKLVIEIVESEGIDNFDTVIDFIKNIKECGCKIAIDDFGTGYSNFEYLMRLKADYIKIDGSMIKNLDTDKNSKIIVAVIVDFAKKMNMKVIAEFVKDEKIEKIVKELGIDYSQGYYLGEPESKPKIKEIDAL